MNELQIQLFGSPNIQQDQDPVTGFVSSKATALVYYLAATNRTQPRDSLATLFWADVSEARAKKNLRDILSNLRKVMGTHLEITRQTVTLTTHPKAVDSSYFEALVSSNEGRGGEGRSTHLDRSQDLKLAAELQTGEFLEGFHVSDAPLFEEWLLNERERFGQLRLQVLGELITESMHSGNYLEGIDYGLRSLALEPLEESTHRYLITMYAANGQYAAALEQYEKCTQLLYNEFGAEPSTETTAVFETVQARQENTAVQTIADDHLPPFVGRSAELNEISRLLASSDCRLLTLVGLGGIGKTRLAIQIAIQDGYRFLDGTYLVTVGSLLSLEQFVTDVANVVGLSLSGDKDPIDQLLDFVRSKSMLIIIDNAEILLQSSELGIDIEIDIEAAPSAPHKQPNGVATTGTEKGAATGAVGLLGMMAESAPGLKLVATSREHLGLRSEWIFEVEGLTTPTVHGSSSKDSRHTTDGASSLPHHEALGSDAVQLFLKRARQKWVDFAPTDSDLKRSEIVAIGQLCHLVDGMPLAIELATGWVSLLSCREIMQEVMKGSDLLASTARDLPERHRSVQAIFDQSWQMLTHGEQEILKKLSVFQKGFSRKAAQQVAGATLPILQKLMQRSFLTRCGQERFELHHLLQQYAWQRGSENADALLATQEAHAHYFSQLLNRRLDAILSEQAEIIGLFTDAEMDNLRAAYDWAVGNQQIALLEEMLEGLYHIYAFRSWLAEGITRFNNTAEVLRRRLHNNPKANASAQVLPAQEQNLIGKLDIRLGRLFQMLGRHEEAERYLAEGLAWAESADNSLEKGLCLLGQANMQWELAKYADAESLGEQSLAIYEQEANLQGAARALYCLGKIRIATGDYRQAKENLSQALGLAQAYHLRSTEAECLGTLGQVCWNQGENGAARHYLEEALVLFRLPHMANQLSEARVLNELGFVAWSQGLYDQAQRHHTQARQIFLRIGNRQGEGNTLGHLGRVAERRIDYKDASRLYAQALTINQQIQDRQGEAVSTTNLAFVAFRQSNFSQATDYFSQARELCQAISFPRYEALCIACLGLLACFRQEYSKGEVLAREAMKLAQQIQDPVVEAWGWLYLGYALSGKEDWHEAATAYGEGLRLRRASEFGGQLLDPLSGLAYIALKQNDLDAAQTYIGEIIERLNNHQIAEAFLQAQIRYVCYRGLAHLEDPDANGHLLKAKEILQARGSSASPKGEEVCYGREPLIAAEIGSL